MSAQIEDDDMAALAYQQELERRGDACERCGEPATAMYCERLVCKDCYEESTVWEPREDFTDDDFPAPEEEEENEDEY